MLDDPIITTLVPSVVRVFWYDEVEQQHAGGGVGVGSPNRRRKRDEHDKRQEQTLIPYSTQSA